MSGMLIGRRWCRSGWMFAGEALAGAMNRPVQVRNGGLYVRGLIEDGGAQVA